ncbi:hypothetical protein SARC_12826 [Sphaeroforma arctica JP610]|uniref:Uncharacterized protein n=1 Tax=Sphaeroforma arctica JP610 TaxID=667725 RepID=A0A0L0FF14_9EUKA|nr:hypothetical protein SARC_12826 [Sphaeroforma arctica JP610]KNC74633.1 hypothetical protein SARC_12826 [Sphaeroforma arctica JP610]|eukprot:XP_014148535.1 hypothetical protein SARC_12826 [Sphaeroforma arctica JP610]
MKQLSPVKHIIGHTNPVPHEPRERLLKNTQNRTQTILTPDAMPVNGSDWYQASNDNVHATRRAQLLTNAQNRVQTIPTPDEMPPNSPDWYQKSKTLVKSPVMNSSQQQMNQSHVTTNLFRDKLQRHRKPRSPEELQKNSQDAANVPIDTIAYRKHLPVHHDNYLEDPQAVKRHKGSEPTEASITVSTAAEMKM